MSRHKGFHHSEETKQKIGKAHFKTGFNIDVHGYKLIRINGKYIKYHRYVYEQYHKCSLLPRISIHHINGNKLDNRIENLEPITKENHTSLHFKKDMSDRICVGCGFTNNKTHWRSVEGKFICNKCYMKLWHKKKLASFN